jgi:dissimilatory sulfite reductase (desulfoviridin) alpha/beta subunit
MPFIKYDDIPKVEAELKTAGLAAGTSGPRLRTTTTCPGTNWCKQGLIDTFRLSDRIEKELGIKCGTDLPHKFKIAISGCPNLCTRPDASEIGIHGQIDTTSLSKTAGYIVYVGGCGGRTPKAGIKLDKVFTEDETLALIGRVVTFFKANAKPRQRLALAIEEFGREKFLKTVIGDIKKEGS